MKVLYRDIKKLIPGLIAKPKEISQALTAIGFMCDEIKEVTIDKKVDTCLSFEVRQNRPDCQSVIGLAREVAAFYNLSVQLPKYELPKIVTDSSKDVLIKATGKVKRVRAVSLNNIKNRPSPSWLKEWLAVYGINSINLLVDLSNYIMIFFGYPSHLFDRQKIKGQLVWLDHHHFQEFVSLDGSQVKLTGEELIIADDQYCLALAGLVGGLQPAVNNQTNEVLLEMAVYDRSKIRQDSRQLGITTEASIRLSRDLDPVSLAEAFDFLLSLIIKETDAKIIGKIYDYFPQNQSDLIIELEAMLPTKLAGVQIEEDQVVNILKRLRFEIKGFSRNSTPENLILAVKCPSDRRDIELPEDLAEEVIRLFGYDRIPSDQLPSFMPTIDLTPSVWHLKSRLALLLVDRGFDEILSQPLVSIVDNEEFNYWPGSPVTTINSVNEEFPQLRQSLAAGLVRQAEKFNRLNLKQQQIFEIGKVFSKRQNQYHESEHLAILSNQPNCFHQLKNELTYLLNICGLNNWSFQLMTNPPKVANPHAAYCLKKDKHEFGFLYQLASLEEVLAVAEIDLNQVLNFLNPGQSAVSEIVDRLVSLDVNLELADEFALITELERLPKLIGQKNFWSAQVVDRYHLKNKIRYTIRVIYQNLDDQSAKKLHQKIFNIKL